MKKFLSLAILSLTLVACVDKTGLSADSSRKPTGNPNAAVVVQEFGDLQCPACKAAYESIVKPLLAQYSSTISLEFKHFPLRSIHEYALDLAEGSECAADQGKFWEFVDIAYTKQSELSRSSIRAWAASLGLDMPLWDRCTKSHIKRATILADYAEGEKRGVVGTPTFFVNGTKVDSNLEAISAAITAATTGAAQRL
ncbi:MAG: oxidoreductase [Candidatus Peribacteria bacterium]|nr:oxidoreductase [Candidatus Peribacteria bacterium]